ncbi:MAG: AsmA family protein, partial [Burkholderiales bacterium]
DELAAVRGAPRPQEKSAIAPALPDMNLSLNARAATYAGQRFETIAARVQVRDGAARAPFSLSWAGARIEGTLAATFDRASMRIECDVTARGLDMARLPGPLAKPGITGKIDSVAVRAEATGAMPGTLLANAAISVDVADARMVLPKSDALPDGARVTFGGNVQAPAAAPIDFSIKGVLGDKPFAASGQLPTLDALFPAGKPHAVRLAIDYDRARLEAAGNATIDRDAPRFSGTMNLSGDTLHTLADLIGFSLPPLGPYKVSTTVDADSDQIKAQDLAMRLGKSEFRGSLAADTRMTRPRFAAKVRGVPVHLEDIGAQAWSPGNIEKRSVKESRSGEPIDQAKLDRDARVLTNILRAFDFDLDLTLDEVSSAGAVVGRAELKAALANGRLAIDPATVWFGQGKFSAEIAIDARGKSPQYAVKFEGTGFEYGPLMRAMDPKSPHSGTLDLSMDIKTFGAPESFAQNASGEFDVLILPKDQEAGALSALGSGVLPLILRTLDPRSQSQLNCIVGSFDIDKGVATSRIVLLDTTLARVAGDLVVDYRTRGLRGTFAPRSKQPRLFPVAPGIIVGGTLDAPDIGVSAQSVVLSALRVWQLPVAFASDWLIRENMPADGTPDCRAAYRHVLH